MIFPLKTKKLIRGADAHVRAGLGIAADFEANFEPLYAPCDGEIYTWQGEQGGNWLRITRSNGDKIEFAHLSQYSKLAGSCKEGELIAITGNTGKVTTGPHLHIQVFINNERVDPERYFEGVEPKIETAETSDLVEKIKNPVKQDNAFSLLILADDSLDQNAVKSIVYETQRFIYQDSNNELTLIPYVSFEKLPVWDNDGVIKIAKNKFDLTTFQGVTAIYAKGKFRKSDEGGTCLAEMNPNYKEVGFLTNLSFEDPDGDTGPYDVATVLTHELMHAFKYLLGMEYVKSVHETPNEFTDDFQSMKGRIQELYYILPKKRPEPSAPVIPAENTDIMPEQTNDKWYMSSTGSGALALRLKGALVALIPVAILAAKLFKVDLSADALGNAISGLVSVIEQVGAVIAAAMVLWGYIRSLKVKSNQ